MADHLPHQLFTDSAQRNALITLSTLRIHHRNPLVVRVHPARPRHGMFPSIPASPLPAYSEGTPGTTLGAKSVKRITRVHDCGYDD
jgi:hypothetical protein